MAAARTRATSTRSASPPASCGGRNAPSATASASTSGSPTLSAPDAAALPRLPVDDEGPVFREPWEAQAFALAVRLSEEGAFTWPEWAEALAAELATDPADDGSRYYQHWVAALEKLAAK